ncbi:chemotaxis protein CheA [Zoogloea sp.]|uniref:chemotaxis protein CheA n=1 Tax=Zoogloea sp. TaxID=49181 RepID=UPI0025FDBF30|nr:chemotaxis protein CheA [Zoogloea sp.]MCK6393645.1 chemotaxis protein CheA [Zoogloea sp.]
MSDDIHGVFVQEARERLDEMEAGLLRLEQGDPDPEILHGIFRAAHTIKGAAGIVELTGIEAFTHVLENLLDRLRNLEISADVGLVSLLLRCCDHLDALVKRVEVGMIDPDPTLDAQGDALVTALRNMAGQAAGPHPVALSRTEEGVLLRDGDAAAMNDCWHVSIRFGRDVLRNGMDPLAFLRYLQGLGDIVHLATLVDGMPEPADMDPESCYLGFEISLRSEAGKAAIEQVFQFVQDDCELRILPPNSRVSEYIDLIASLPEETLRLGEILLRCGALTAEELARGLALQAQGADCGDSPAQPLGEILVASNQVQTEIVEAAAAKQKSVAERKAVDARLIRVQAEKLDQLIDLVGELVIAGAAANLMARSSGQAGLVESTSMLSRLVESIRDSALQLRMVQIGETFNRFQRVVRDVSRDLGKDVALVVSGGETELDKSVVEKIGDPLMHLVRNAMDHGIESADLRQARGKPARGCLRLHAAHDSGSILIEVSDDGGGLNRARILAKAIERGIVQAGAELADHEICNLIFEPGFSTADKVTNLSGRGVGMDVVRKNIQALRGTVEVSSVEGQGSCFNIRLPLTLAIIDGFLAGVGRASYVLPLESVVECLELRGGSWERDYLDLRGEVLPFVRLRELFEIAGPGPTRENVIVVKSGGSKVGIVVDALQGECQTVIKPLATLFRNLRGIAGSTILGSGDVALILDVDAIVRIAAGGEQKRLLTSVSMDR